MFIYLAGFLATFHLQVLTTLPSLRGCSDQLLPISFSTVHLVSFRSLFSEHPVYLIPRQHRNWYFGFSPVEEVRDEVQSKGRS
jgi:hypothetical protein